MARQRVVTWVCACLGLQELAGLGGDVKHVRGTVSAQYNWTWGRTLDETRAREGKTPTTGGFLKDWLSSGLVRVQSVAFSHALRCVLTTTVAADTWRFWLGWCLAPTGWHPQQHRRPLLHRWQ